MARALGTDLGQPVEIGHVQRVAFTHGGEDQVEARAGAGRTGETVIGVDAILDNTHFQKHLPPGG